ncbi:MAG TPA: permease [Gaiellaceae bacterium]|nr:permease [Gaiellaceae bacterium]
MGILEAVGDGLWNAFRMAWEVGWALILGFALSGVVQAWIPRTRMERALGGRDLRTMGLAAGLGAASSSCSYAAVAIAKSMFQKGASLATAMVFQFASTNLVFEIGIVMWIFLGWQFTLAEFVGGLLLIVLMWAGMRLLVTQRLEKEARQHAVAAQAGHEHRAAATEGLSWKQRLTSLEAWSDVAYNFRGDWEMLWKEITAGFVIAGFIALLPMDFFNALFVTDAPGWLRLPENVLVGPLVAVLSFVCSVGNVPLAAVLWAGGISFAGVIAFIYADLLVIPILLIYRKYYGLRATAVIAGIMLTAIVLAALTVDSVFELAGLIPDERPDIESITERSIEWNYTTFLNIVFFGLAAGLVALTMRRGARDPVCGMTVDRFKTPYRSEWQGQAYYFCSAGCKERFDIQPERYLDPSGRVAVPMHAGGDGHQD